MRDLGNSARSGGLRRSFVGLVGAIGLSLLAILLPGVSGPAGAAGVCRPAPEYLATAGDVPVGGIGGTGRGVDPGDAGAGGIGGTGIVGTITGFASVCVNGLEVHYGDDVPVAENGRSSSVSALAVGQVVALEAGRGRLGLTARRIEIVHALEGPVTRSESGRLEVMGATVLPADATLAAATADLRPGDWAQVSGHRDQAGRWMATRVARIAPRAEATLQGPADGDGRLAGVRVASETSIASGSTRLVRGEWLSGTATDAGHLRVREAVPSPAALIIERAERVVVETRVREVRDGKVRSGLPEFDDALSGRSLREGELVRVRGARSPDGRLVAERLERQAGRDGSDRSTPDRGRSDKARDRDENRQPLRNDADRDRRDDRGERVDRLDDRDRNGRERTDRGDRNDRIERPDRGDRRSRD